MEIIKRTGKTEIYNGQKIISAIAKAFKSTGRKADDAIFCELLASVEKKLADENTKSVEVIQDLVEKSLMESGFFDEAKRYILFRQKRTEKRTERKALRAMILGGTEAQDEALGRVLLNIQKSYDDDIYSLVILKAKFSSFTKERMTRSEQLSALTRAASELISPEAPKWEFIAARLLNFSFHEQLAKELEQQCIHSFYEKIDYLTKEQLYGSYILNSYSRQEIETAASFIDTERDNLFTYAGLDLLLNRYVIHTHKLVPLETVQEMFLGIALHLAMNETQNRMEWVKKFYDMLSRMEVTMATPTLANARKPYHQLSSCFIDTVPDSLDGIYRSLDNFASQQDGKTP